jgi:hypothetical protein
LDSTGLFNLQFWSPPFATVAAVATLGSCVAKVAGVAVEIFLKAFFLMRAVIFIHLALTGEF